MDRHPQHPFPALYPPNPSYKAQFTQSAIQSLTKHLKGKMTAFRRHCSRAATSYSEGHLHHQRQESFPTSLKDFYLRKSLFNPSEGEAQVIASRRHIAGAEVPRIEIVHYSPRWLLLQAPQTKSNFFDKINRGKLGCKEEQILKIFKAFVALVRHFGYFRPTAKMIFLEKMEVRVWMSEDVFSSAPMMPITRGAEGQKHFVIAFLAMVETYLDEWDRVSNVTTIQDTFKMLEWRCQLAKGSKAALRASKQVNGKFQQSRASFTTSEDQHLKVTSSQNFNQVTIEQDSPRKSVTYSRHNTFFRQASELKTFSIKAINFEEDGQADKVDNCKKPQFALNTTSSSIGAFCQQWRTTLGRKKLMEKAEQSKPNSPNQSNPTPVPPPTTQTQNIEMEFKGLFPEEGQVDEAELQRIAEQIQEVLTW